MITRREMNHMAKYIRDTDYTENTKKAMALMAIAVCNTANPRFNEERFLIACEVDLL
jgi:N-acetylmuramoyl-L-alanine amidase CwlA